jgi:hypothetical protein
MPSIAARPFMCALALFFYFTVFSNVLLTTAFECGAPQAPCGRDIPEGTTCPKGARWCTAGHYCGYEGDGSKCTPLPKNCGKAGYECCPSNAETPHTSTTKALDREPFCKDGSTCAYNSMALYLSETPDTYAGVKGER